MIKQPNNPLYEDGTMRVKAWLISWLGILTFIIFCLIFWLSYLTTLESDVYKTVDNIDWRVYEMWNEREVERGIAGQENNASIHYTPDDPIDKTTQGKGGAE